MRGFLTDVDADERSFARVDRVDVGDNQGERQQVLLVGGAADMDPISSCFKSLEWALNSQLDGRTESERSCVVRVGRAEKVGGARAREEVV